MRDWLKRAPNAVFNLYAIGAAFTAYFCMYAFRKPFAVGEYAGQSLEFLGLELRLKDALVLSQLIGYAASKYIGVKICSEVARGRRVLTLLILIGWAECALLLFGLLPQGWKPLALFLNGLPLGMVWGVVFSFLEGRRSSDLLGAGLSCSYIIASGAVKSVGQVLLGRGVDEFWMPLATGALFALPFMVAVWLLGQLPSPDSEDVAERSERREMTSSDRWGFLKSFHMGLVPLLALYFLMTAYRDFRDNYAKEIWNGMGLGGEAAVYAVPEVFIAFGVLAAMAGLVLIRDNRVATICVYAMMILASLLVEVSTFAFQQEWMGPTAFMTLVGLGLYLAYVPFGCVLFDRLVAMLGVAVTAVFTIQLSDAIGYTGSIAVVLYKHFGQGDMSELEFFETFGYVMAAVSVLGFVVSLAYFLFRARELRAIRPSTAP